MLSIITLSPQFEIQSWPEEMAVLTGKEESQVIGKNLFAAFPDLKARGLQAIFENCRQSRVPTLISHALHHHIFAPPEGEAPRQSAWLVPTLQGGELRGFVLAIEEAGERQALELVFRRRAAFLEALLNIRRAMATQDDEGILQTLVQQTAHLFEAPRAEIYMLEGDHLVLGVGHTAPGIVNTEVIIPLGRGVTGKTALSGQAVRVLDVDSHPDYIRGVEGMRAEMAAPIRLGNTIYGILDVESDRPEVFDFPEALTMLQSLADEAGLALQQARLRQREQKRLRHLATLREFGLRLTEAGNLEALYQLTAAYAVRLLDASAAFIYTYDADQDTAARERDHSLVDHRTGLEYAAGPGIAGLEDSAFRPPRPFGLVHTVARTGHLLVVNDPTSSPFFQSDAEAGTTLQAAAALPVRRGESVHAVLSVRFSYPHHISKEEIETLELLCEQLAAHLESTALYERTQQQLNRLNSLRQIETTITTTMNLTVILDEILNHAIRQVGADAAAIWFYEPVLQTLHHAASCGFRSEENKRAEIPLLGDHAALALSERRIIPFADLNLIADRIARRWLLEREGFVSGLLLPLTAKGEIVGLMELYARREINFPSEVIDFLETITRQVAVAIDNVRLFEHMQTSNLDLAANYGATVRAWAHTLEERGFEPPGHLAWVERLALPLAEAFGIEEQALVNFQRGALLHDIGMLHLPDSVVLKADELSAEEWEQIKQHPLLAARALRAIPFLRPAIDIPLYHHERWDGSGYPEGLRGEQIPLTARIFAVVDVWVSLRSEKPYRPAHTLADALKILDAGRGRLFDPQVVERFLKMFGESDML
ncbi:MAG: GAF domain-containing protein [Anaerolineae bacterium]|nr:MAG: GAF domain-containing protein [Anaerolineae bacterium]